MEVDHLIEHYGLLPHPEGGWFKETYRSSETISADGLPSRFTGDHSFSTAILFLLEKGNFSGFHRIKSDECWHFYTGQTLLVYVLHEGNGGRLEVIRLGNNYKEGEEVFQYVVPAGCWFASVPAETSEFSFLGCTVSPGFDFSDFELAKADDLVASFPQYEEVIRPLCRN
jgi:predicted cupin superfamily sugar epimerase